MSALINRERVAVLLSAAFALITPFMLMRGEQTVGESGIPQQPTAFRLPPPGSPDIISALPLFNAGRQVTEAVVKDPPPSTTEENAGPVASSPPRLVGTITAPGRPGLALLRTESGTTATLRAGETLDGWTLIAVRDSAVDVSRGDERESLRLNQKRQEAQSAQAANGSPSPPLPEAPKE